MGFSFTMLMKRRRSYGGVMSGFRPGPLFRAGGGMFEEVSAMDRQWGDISPDMIVNPLSSTRRVEKKGRKWGAVHDTNWDEILRENLEKIGANAPEQVKQVKIVDEAPSAEIMPETEDDHGHDLDADIVINNEEDLEKIMKDIKKMADEPEKLGESHLGVFIEPVPNGKWVNSQG